MKKIILFRERRDVSRIERELRPLKVLWCPALSMKAKKFRLPEGPFDYLLTTSSNALRFVSSSTLKKLKIRRRVTMASGKEVRQFFRKQKGDRAGSPPRILYLRSSLGPSLGDKTLVRDLRRLGFRLVVRFSYETKILNIRKPLRRLLSRDQVSAFFLTSPSTVLAVKRALSARERKALSVRWISIGPTTSDALKKLGVSVRQAQTPSLRAMEAVLQF